MLILIAYVCPRLLKIMCCQMGVSIVAGSSIWNPGQQGELLDEFAAYFSEEPVLGRVCGVWLLFVFLVCSIVTLSMTVCLECEIVEFLCLFGTVAVRGKGRLESCVSALCYCCVQLYANSHSTIFCLVCVFVLFAFIWSRASTVAWY